MIISLLIFIAVLALLVLVHEFGHFIVAKKAGMKVEEFGFGFPPRLLSWKKGETTWSINLIPLGGFVQIAGENGGEDKIENLSISNSVDEMVTITETKEEVFVNGEEVLEKDEVIINSKNQEGRLFSDKPIWKRVLVLIAGVTMNFLLGWVIISIILMFGVEKSVVVSTVSDGSPAQKIGIEAGDMILGYDNLDNFTSFVQANKGKEISLDVRRGKEIKKIAITPRENPPEGEGSLGVGLSLGGVERQPFFSAIWDGLKRSVEIFGFIYTMLFKLIGSLFGGEALYKQVSGPIGIYKATTQATGLGIMYLANLIALISINLAAINIFPFPALDGGRVIVLMIEKIIKRPISLKIQQIVNGVGFIFLILLMVLATFQDVKKLF